MNEIDKIMSQAQQFYQDAADQEGRGRFPGQGRYDMYVKEIIMGQGMLVKLHMNLSAPMQSKIYLVSMILRQTLGLEDISIVLRIKMQQDGFPYLD